MKIFKVSALAGMMAVMASGPMAHAHGHGHGFIAGVLASTAAVFATMLTHDAVHHKELVYIGAADEAAAYLQSGGEPSALLREAMETERGICIQAGVKDAENFDDELLAELVVGRVTQLDI